MGKLLSFCLLASSALFPAAPPGQPGNLHASMAVQASAAVPAVRVSGAARTEHAGLRRLRRDPRRCRGEPPDADCRRLAARDPQARGIAAFLVLAMISGPPGGGRERLAGAW